MWVVYFSWSGHLRVKSETWFNTVGFLILLTKVSKLSNKTLYLPVYPDSFIPPSFLFSQHILQHKIVSFIYLILGWMCISALVIPESYMGMTNALVGVSRSIPDPLCVLLHVFTFCCKVRRRWEDWYPSLSYLSTKDAAAASCLVQHKR